MDREQAEPLFFPPAPPGGGYLVLGPAHLGSLDLLCLIKRIYPQTRIIAQHPIPLSR